MELTTHCNTNVTRRGSGVNKVLIGDLLYGENEYLNVSLGTAMIVEEHIDAPERCWMGYIRSCCNLMNGKLKNKKNFCYYRVKAL
jgi:hypothetical protein